MITDQNFPKNYFKIENIDNDHLEHFFFTRNIKNNTNKYSLSSEQPEIISSNKQSLAHFFGRTKENVCLANQVHGTEICVIDRAYSLGEEPVADGLITKEKNLILLVRTADCLPILFLDKKNSIIGVVHAGWKGAKAGIIEKMIEKLIDLGSNESELIAIIGPCIRQENYEIDKDFFDGFIADDPSSGDFFQKISSSDKFLFDLPLYGIRKLEKLGITFLDTELDSFSREEDFLSFRRTTLRKLAPQGNTVSAIMLK